MCFSVLLGSWLVLHVQHFAAVAAESNHVASTVLNNKALLLHARVNETIITAEEVRWSMEVINQNRSNADFLTVCNNSTRICLTPIKCPRTINENETVADYGDKFQCFRMFINQDDFVNRDEIRQEENSMKPTPTEVWGFGILSVGIISLSGLFGGLLWPLMSSKYYDHAMRMLIGLAVGTLTATSSMQLIPQGFGIKETEVDSYLQTSIVMLSSLWILYMFEISCKIFFHSKNENENKLKLQEKTSAMNEDCNEKIKLEHEGLLPKIVTDSTNRRSSLRHFGSSKISLNDIHLLEENNKIPRKASHSQTQQIQMGGMAPVAWMVILGDGLHNFVDGMSIGAGFSNSLSTGLSISIAIACEEFPHELGDFAILVNSGMSIKRALMFNFLSALTAVAGLVFGILLGQLEASTYIFAFSGGLFLYISLTDLMPELNSMVEEGLKISKHNALLRLLQQNCGILFGFFLLYLISVNLLVNL